jgi:hypothetical protein
MDLDRWVNDNNPDEQLQYGKGWWDYIELIRENSHANHTWDLPSRQNTCFQGPEALPVWVRFPSPAPLPG